MNTAVFNYSQPSSHKQLLQPSFGMALAQDAKDLIENDSFTRGAALSTAVSNVQRIDRQGYSPDSAAELGKTLANLYAGLPASILDDNEFQTALKEKLASQARGLPLTRIAPINKSTITTILQEFEKCNGTIPTPLVKLLIEIAKENS